jgi:hypothetical protein
VEVKSEPKSYSAQAIAEVVPALHVRPAESIPAALEAIAANQPAFRALVFGSLYLWLETAALNA